MTNNQTATDEIEIDLLKLAQVLLHRAKFIIVCTLLVAAAAFGITHYLITPLYTSTALMYVNNSSFSVGSTSFSISSAELTAAKSLVDTYGVILKSRNTLEDVIRRDSLTYTYEELYEMIETEAVNSTEIFQVSVTSPDPAEAESIANTIAEVLPEKISAIVDGSDVRIVDYAVIPSERTSPSYTINVVIGALVGFIVAAAIVILRYLFDESIRTEDYLTQTYPNIPLLAVVPDMMGTSGKGYYGDYYTSERPGSSDKKGSEKRSAARTQQPKAVRSAEWTDTQDSRRPASGASAARPAARPASRPASAAQTDSRPVRPASGGNGTGTMPAGDVKKGGNRANG